MQRLLRTFLKTAQSLLAANHFGGRRNPKRRRRLNSTDPLEERCLLALGDVIHEINLFTPIDHTYLVDGVDVAIHGSRAVISSYTPKSIYEPLVYVGSASLYDVPSGLKLLSFPIPSGVDPSDFVGWRGKVALNSQYALMTAKSGSIASNVVLVFDLQGNFVREIPDPLPYDGRLFGEGALAVSGDFVLVGSRPQAGGSTVGRAFLFRISTGELLQTFQSPSSTQVAFGFSVAFDGDVVVIGDPADSANGSSIENNGAVFAFNTAGTLLGSWQPSASEDRLDDGRFGVQVATDGASVFANAGKRLGPASATYRLHPENPVPQVIHTQSGGFSPQSIAVDAKNFAFSSWKPERDPVTYSTTGSSSVLTILPDFPVSFVDSSSDAFNFFRTSQQHFGERGSYDIFGESLSVDRGYALVSSASFGKAYLVEAFDDFRFDASAAPANVTRFLLRRSGDDVQMVNADSPSQVLASRALNSTSGIRLKSRSGNASAFLIDADQSFQLPYLQRSMPIAIDGGNVSVTSGAFFGLTRVSSPGPDQLSIVLDASNNAGANLIPTIDYSGTGTVTFQPTSATLEIETSTRSQITRFADDPNLIELRDTTPNPGIPAFIFHVPNKLDVRLPNQDARLDLDSYPPIYRNYPVNVYGGGGADILNIAAEFDQTVFFNGGDGGDRLNVPSTESQIWNITGPNRGNVGPTTFESVESLGGGSGTDVFQFGPNGSLSGSFDGGGGVNVIDFSNAISNQQFPIDVNLQSNRFSLASGQFSGIQRIIGNSFTPDSVTNLIAPNQESLWKLTSRNSGIMQGARSIVFENFNHLVGGNLADIFRFENANAIITGSIDGGTGGINQLDWSLLSTTVEVSITNRQGLATFNESVMNLTSIERFVGSGATTNSMSILGESTLWQMGGVTGQAVDGTITALAGQPANWNYVNFQQITAALDSTLAGPGSLNTWTIDGTNAGNVNSAVHFNGFPNLITGPGNNRVVIAENTGFLSGTLDGGIGQLLMDYSAWNRPVTVNREQGTSNSVERVLRLSSVIGTSQQDKIIGRNVESNWSLSTQFGGSIAGNINNSFTFLSFEQIIGGTEKDTLLGADVSQIWNVTGSGRGKVGAFDFDGIENLVGGSLDDQFEMAPTAVVAGRIDGGGGTDVLNYQMWTSLVFVEQRSPAPGSSAFGAGGIRASGMGDGFSGIESIIAGEGSQDTLTGQNDFLINGLNSGTVNADKTYALNYSGFENLAGAVGEYSAFRFVPGGFVSGDIDGGAYTGRLDYSGTSGLVVEIDLADFTAPLIGGHWSNISGFTGSDNVSRIRATNDDATWFLTDHTSVNDYIAQVIYSPLGHEFDLIRTFTSFNDLRAGSGDDTFYFETLFPKRMEAFPGYKYFYGSIDGGGGYNEVSLNQSQGSNTFGDITLNLQDETFTPISGTIQNIDLYARRSSLLEDTFRIIAPDQNNEWTIQSIDARNVYNSSTQQFETRYMATGSINGIEFERFDSLVGGAVDDRFVCDYYVPFKVDPGTGNNTIVFPAYGPEYGTILFDYALNRDNLIGFQTLEARSPTALAVGDFSTTWDIDGHNSGRVENSITPIGGLQFRGITAVFGAATALDTVRFHDGGRLDGRLSANGTFQPGNDIVDYSAVTTPVTVSVALSLDNIGDTTGIGGQMNGFGVFIGGQSDDTFVADTLPHRWDILGLNRGVINSAVNTGAIYDPFSEGPAQFRFDGFENLVGGRSSDLFRFAPLGDITGTIDRQLSVPGNFYNELFFGLAVVPGVPKPVGRTIDLQRYQHVGSIMGSPGIDTLVGPDSNNEWVFGRDGQSVTSSGWTTYWDAGGLENVRGGTADDSFHLSRLSTVFPQIDGGYGAGIDVLDVAEMTSAVAMNLQSGVVRFNATDLNQPVQVNASNIEHVRGSAVPGSVVTGADASAVWQLNSEWDWSWNGAIRLENFDSIIGGSQDDRFLFASESTILSGSVDGGDGINTIDYSAFTDSFSVWADLQPENGIATNLGAISRIQNVTGGAGDDTVIIYDDGIDHFVDGGPHQFGDTLQYISYGNGIVRTPGGNADHGSVKSGSGAVTAFIAIEQFLTDGVELTGILETSSSLSDGLLTQGENSIEVRFTQNLAFEFDPQAFKLFHLTDPDGSGIVQEIPVSILLDRISDDRVRLIRINEYGDVVSLGSGHYRLRVSGDALFDANGSAIDGDGDGTTGGEYVEQFRIPTTQILSAPEASSIASAAAANPILNEIVFTYSSPVNGFVQFPNDGIILSIADDDGNFQYVPAHLEFSPDDPLSFRLVPDTQVGFVQAFADGLYRVQLDTSYVTDITGELIDGDGDDQPGGGYIRYFRFANSAPTEITLSNNTVREGLPAGSFIGFLNIQDPDPVDNDQTRFQIFTEWPFSAVNYGDRFALVTAEPLSFDQQSTWQTTVTVFDHAGAGFSQSFTIDVTAALLCPPGTYSLTGFLDGSERLADPGFYVPASGATFAIPAPAGMYIPVSGATSLDAAIVSPAGYYAPEGSAAPIIAPAGYYAPEGSAVPIIAPAGYYAPEGSAAPIISPAGYYAPKAVPHRSSHQPDTTRLKAVPYQSLHRPDTTRPKAVPHQSFHRPDTTR
ncbi:MAG: hypothetical protein R3C17_00220 [Planctomycetaceae bacterium]